MKRVELYRKLKLKTKENGNMVRGIQSSSYPGFELPRLYCICLIGLKKSSLFSKRIGKERLIYKLTNDSREVLDCSFYEEAIQKVI